jgi:hypothetical protein
VLTTTDNTYTHQQQSNPCQLIKLYQLPSAWNFPFINLQLHLLGDLNNRCYMWSINFPSVSVFTFIQFAKFYVFVNIQVS